MDLAGYVKCLKKHAMDKKISDEKFFNAVLRPYIDAGEIDDKFDKEIYFDKSRTSLILNRHEDVPNALRRELGNEKIYLWIEENFKDFLEQYINPNEIGRLVEEVTEMVKTDRFISDKNTLLRRKTKVHAFLAYVLIECIKLKNDGFNPEGEILRNGSYCLKVVYKDIFQYAFKNRSKEKNIVVIPVDTEFHTHVTRKYEKRELNEVSPTSIHGQFLNRWEQSGEDIDLLEKRIKDSLKSAKNKNGKYPLGTISIIERDNTIFYLMAISEFDENNNAHSSKKEIVYCVDKLTDFYDKYGDGHNLFIPLIGTGKSRAAVSLQESFDILTDCYKQNPYRIQGNIYIVIRKELEKLVSTGLGGR